MKTVEVVEDTPAEAALRREVRSWIEELWDPKIDPAAWRATIIDSGWAYCTWRSDACGRGVAPELAHVVEAELERAGAGNPGFGSVVDVYINFMGHTIAEHGSDEMKRTVLPKLLRGELGQGCLLYSEPGAGSDLGALQTRASRDGDGYLVNGQKIWSSMAATAEWGLLVARTNWDVPKHRGLSFFLFPFKIDGELQKGIDIRPIKQINGETHFNEVFFTDAWVPAANLVGDENDGWRVLQTALAAERLSMSRIFRDTDAGFESSPVLEAAADFMETARGAGKADDPVIRQTIAQIHTWRLVQQWTAERAAVELNSNGASSLASLGKLANSRILHATGSLLRLLEGPTALLFDYDDIDRTTPNFRAMGAFVNSIGGGSDQIQRNIIGERILGLPKGPEPDRGRPFREVPKGVAVRKFS
jgi:alkylation response protein AidB-like acyl-CoA dehydrogenase